MLILVVAFNDQDVLQWGGQRGNDICQEEVSEANFAEWRDDDVAQSSGKLFTALQLEAVERHEADDEEEDEQTDGEVLDRTVSEVRVQFDLGYLPRQAEEHDQKQEGRYSVELVMDDQLLVDLIELENENIVNIVAPEDLNGKPSAKKHENQRCQEVIGVHA